MTCGSEQPNCNKVRIQIECNILHNKGFVSFTDDQQKWKVDRIRSLEGFSCPDYVTLTMLNDSESGVVLASEKPFKFRHDSMKPLQNPVKEVSAKQGKYFM